jgi:hypothetical protein
MVRIFSRKVAKTPKKANPEFLLYVCHCDFAALREMRFCFFWFRLVQARQSAWIYLKMRSRNKPLTLNTLYAKLLALY